MYNRCMNKKSKIFRYAIILLICQVFTVPGFVILGGSDVSADENEKQSNISQVKLDLISDHCDSIREKLKNIQKNDARARVYLGAHYETILSNYITKLNLKLVEKSVSNSELIENQNKYAKAKATFSDDYIKYQKDLEELVAMDCKSDAKAFYEKLSSVRKKREVMVQDTLRLSKYISEHKKLVGELRGRL